MGTFLAACDVPQRHFTLVSNFCFAACESQMSMAKPLAQVTAEIITHTMARSAVK